MQMFLSKWLSGIFSRMLVYESRESGRETSGPRAQALAQTLLEKLLEIDMNVDVDLHRYR